MESQTPYTYSNPLVAAAKDLRLVADMLDRASTQAPQDAVLTLSGIAEPSASSVDHLKSATRLAASLL